MPADTKAVAYEWYMTVAADAQIVKWRWEPNLSSIRSSMTEGEMKLYVRDSVDDEWSVKDLIGVNLEVIPWVVAQNITRQQGFTVEVAVYEDN